MIDPLLTKCNVKRAFISDDIYCYKGNATGNFFENVLTQLNIKPEKILHIGDSSADIIGAHSVRMNSCWINRDNSTWNHPVKPNFVIHNLNEIFDIIG